MSRFVVTARKDGRGLVRPFVDGEKHTGETFYIGGRGFKVTADGRVYIPKSVMERFGTLVNGKRSIVLETGGTYEKAKEGVKYVRTAKTGTKLIQGADILQSPTIDAFLQTAKTGDRVPDSVVGEGIEELKILKPRDGVDLYKS